MMARCYKSSYRNFKRWGGRGITVCSEWHDMNVFFEWAQSNGYAKGLQIDRIDNNGNYEPLNCRFITHKENNNNKSTNVYITHNGVTKTRMQWSEVLNIPYDRIRSKMRKGITDPELLLAS